MKPRFQHDCDKCIFLGHFNEHDVYFCPKSNGGSLLARYGDDGPDYASSPVCCLAVSMRHTDVDYIQAWKQALQLLKPLIPVLSIA